MTPAPKDDHTDIQASSNEADYVRKLNKTNHVIYKGISFPIGSMELLDKLEVKKRLPQRFAYNHGKHRGVTK